MWDERYRGNRIGMNFDVLLWVQARVTPFKGCVMARELEITPHRALRYLRALEDRDVVTSDRSCKPWVWTSTFVAESK